MDCIKVRYGMMENGKAEIKGFSILQSDGGFNEWNTVMQVLAKKIHPVHTEEVVMRWGVGRWGINRWSKK